MKRWLVPSVLLFASFNIASAQSDREIVNQPIEWFAFTGNLKVAKSTSLIVEGQFRFAHSFDPMQFQLRTAVNITLSKHLSIVPFGYVYTLNERYGKQPTTYVNNEHRFWEQVAYKHNVGRVKADHRVRLEQRFIQVHSTTREGIIVDEGFENRQTRLRYRFNIAYPLSNKPEAAFLSFYDEVFFSWGKKVSYHKPDQNRVFAGIGLPLYKSFTLQGGFIYQMLVKDNGLKQENNLGFLLAATYNLNLLNQ